MGLIFYIFALLLSGLLSNTKCCVCAFYVHSYLLPDKNRNSKQKTPVAKRSVNPVWNYTFAYDDVSLNELSERALELTIWDHDRLASNEFLGGVRFSLGTGKALAIIIITTIIITTRNDHCHIAQSIRIVRCMLSAVL